MYKFQKPAMLGLLASLMSFEQSAAEIKVIATIKPLHSLVSAVMGDVAKPSLLMDGNQSPHDFAFKPSQAKALQDAELVFWIGAELEGFLVKPLKTVAADAKSVALLDGEHVLKLPLREGFGHDRHDHKKEHDDHEEHADHDSNEASHDPHIWLDPENAKNMVIEIKEALAKYDPNNAAKYKMNADATLAKLSKLSASIEVKMEPVEHKGFIAFHDLLQYFEGRFHVRSVDAITLNPTVAPSAAKVKSLQAQLAENKVSCILSEPQMNDKVIKLLLQEGVTRHGVVDPLGANVEAGPELYFTMMDEFSDSLSKCLGAK